MPYYSELNNHEQNYTIHIMVGEARVAPIRTFHGLTKEMVEKLLDSLYAHEWEEWGN